MGFGHTKWKKLRTMSELSKQTKTKILGTHEGKIVKKLVRKIQRSPLSAWGTISTKGGNIVRCNEEKVGTICRNTHRFNPAVKIISL